MAVPQTVGKDLLVVFLVPERTHRGSNKWYLWHDTGRNRLRAESRWKVYSLPILPFCCRGNHHAEHRCLPCPCREKPHYQRAPLDPDDTMCGLVGFSMGTNPNSSVDMD